MRETFEVDNVSADISQKNCERWDSLRHLTLASELEDAFDIELEPEEIAEAVSECMINAKIPSMIVTLGSRGAVYADRSGRKGFYRASKVNVKDTTGAGDAFCAGVAAALTYGKDLPGAVEIGTRLAASVITALPAGGTWPGSES